MVKNPITPTIPLDQDGVHHGHLRLPYSRNDSAWGAVMIPITVIRNGVGPTALFTGANHGDEYEGPVALQSLALSLNPDDIQGRVILIPMMNTPAFQAATRVSPIDGMNLNRAFPGAPDGSVTQKIADYFQNTLVPMADLVLDFHAGGKTLDFLPFAACHALPDADLDRSSVAAVQAFNAPYSARMVELDSVGMYDTAVEDQGKIIVTTELGGGGTATARSIAIAKKGARNLLIHMGILRGELEVAPTENIAMPDDGFVISESAGLIEPLIDLGAEVAKDQAIARIWTADRMGIAPVEYTAPRAGILLSRHFPGLVKMGDCLAVIATRL